jgi:hypothetical protein
MRGRPSRSASGALAYYLLYFLIAKRFVVTQHTAPHFGVRFGEKSKKTERNKRSKAMEVKNIPIYLFLVVLTLLYCNGPFLDYSISPPVIGSPIYRCASVVSYSGADRNSKIHFYVNGTKVQEITTWMGWGEAPLPLSLHVGDTVTATQVIGNRISVKTREPIAVKDIPSDKLVKNQLLKPQILPPLYECQQVVIAQNILNGATTHLNKNGAEISSGSTPYGLIRFGVPKLSVNEVYQAWQEICKDPLFKSDPSDKETAQKKPDLLPAPAIHKPLVAGNDAFQIDNLVLGAEVKIYSRSGTNPPSMIGGGLALAQSVIYKISPTIDPSLNYFATQTLCELESTTDTVPGQKKVPPPILQPVCHGNYYVIVCNTVTMSTLKIFVSGIQCGQAAGNGDCVTIALGNSRILQGGQRVIALQEVGNVQSDSSAPVLVSADATPPFDPASWNNPAWVTCNNCYNYGCDIRTDNFAQPGYAHGVSHSTNCPTVSSAAIADGLTQANQEKQCRSCTHIAALVMDPGVDYHWYRLDNTGRWSHKPGPTPATDVDASGNKITNPETANRDYSADYDLNYKVFCGYFCVDKNNVVIAGPRSCN